MKSFRRLILVSTLIFALFTVAAWPVLAGTRAIIIPGRTAILIMEGMSSSGVDLDPRNLYDAIQMAPIKQPSGEGKVIKTIAKDFSLACGTRNSTRESVVCNIAIKPSANSKIESSHAEFSLAGAEATSIYEKLAGAGAASAFFFETANKQMRIEATRERFDFTFHR